MSSKFARRKSSTVSGAPQGERGVTLKDFWAHGPSGMFIYMPCREPWSATSVNAVIERQPVLNKNGVPVTDANGKTKTMPAATWLLKFRRVEQMTGVLENRRSYTTAWPSTADGFIGPR